MDEIRHEYTCRAPQERREATISRTATSPDIKINVGNKGQPEPVRKRRIADLPPESELPCGPALRRQLLMRSVKPRRNEEDSPCEVVSRCCVRRLFSAENQ